MSTLIPLTQITRAPLEQVLGPLLNGEQNQEASKAHALNLCSKAKSYGLNVRDYLDLAIDTRLSNSTDKSGRINNVFNLGNGKFMSGYDATLYKLGLPFKQDFKSGVLLQAASDTFQYNPGSRILFPHVIDDMLQWQSKIDDFENTSALVAQSRTVSGPVIQTQAIFDDNEAERQNGPIAEMANIPVQTLTDTEHSVPFYKFGSAIRTSYEFQRRVTLDVLTPYANRVERTRELGKVAVATHILINGDSVHAPADVYPISSFNGDAAQPLRKNYEALVTFLVKMRKDHGKQINLIVGNLDAYLELFLMFSPTTNGKSEAEVLQEHGGPQVSMALDLLRGVNFELSSKAPEGRLICYSKEDTLEELNEAGSEINESEQSVTNQSIKYVKTANHGYRLIYGDTRAILDYKN